MEEYNNDIDKDISREGLTWAKALQPFRLFRAKYNRAIAKLDEFTDLDLDELQETFNKIYELIILDIDECVAPHHGEIFQENIDKIVELVNQGIKFIVFSNMKASDRYQPLIEATNGEVEIHMSKFAKPDPRGPLECCEKANIPKKNTLMIGDNFITDGGAIRAGVDFIKIKPIKTKGESFKKKLKRSPQVFTRWLFSKISNGYDMILRRKVVKTNHPK